MKQSTFSQILRRLKAHTPLFILTLLCAAVTVAGQILTPLIVGEIIDRIVGEGQVAFAEVYRLFVLLAAATAASALGQYFVSILSNRIAYHVLAQVRREGFVKLGVLPLSYIDNRPYGDVSSVLLTDAEQFADGLLLGFTQLFTGSVTILGVLVIMFVKRWEIALVVLFVTPLSLLAARFIASRTYRLFHAQTLSRAEQTAYTDEMIAGLRVVKAYTREEENERQFKELNDDLKKKSLAALFSSSLTNPVTRFINSVVYAAVALSGALLAIATAGTAAAFTVGQLTTFLSYSNQYTKPFNEISEVIAEFQNALACAKRVFAFIDEEEQPSDAGGKSLGRAKGKVTLEDVSFCYDPARPLIEHLNLRAEAGKRIAIVGPTGCGKTTLINLLMRFYDVNSGAVKADGIDVRDLKRRSLRENYGMVLQETWLKVGTVRENLCMGAENATEEEMISAAKAAHIHASIMRLPQGYDTVIGGEGTLSEGERQLLCIARVMLCRPPMLILDEATSSIDTRTELLVQDALARLMQGRTCFVVAHRLSTVRTADCILVMNAGHIVEQGAHETLLGKGGFYSKLYNAQFEG